MHPVNPFLSFIISIHSSISSISFVHFIHPYIQFIHFFHSSISSIAFVHFIHLYIQLIHFFHSLYPFIHPFHPLPSFISSIYSSISVIHSYLKEDLLEVIERRGSSSSKMRIHFPTKKICCLRTQKITCCKNLLQIFVFVCKI